MNRKFLLFALLLVLGVYTSNFAQGAMTPVLTEYPTGLGATAVSPTQINLSWTAPTQNYGKTIAGYKIEQEVGIGVYDTLVYNSGSTITAYSVTGLKTGTTYTYRVSAVYSDDTSSSASNPASATPTTTSKPTASSITGAALTNTQFDFVPPDGTTLSGVIMSSDDYLSLQYKKDPRAVLLNPVPTAYHANNNLSNLLAYQVNHLAADSVPAPLVAKAISDKGILLTWLPPLEQYGQKLLGYKVEVKNNQGLFQSIDDDTETSDTKYPVTGLDANTTYTYRVSAVYPGTHSNPSNEATATTLVPIISTPSQNQTTTVPSQVKTPPQTTPQTTPTQTVNNVKFDLTAPDGTLLAGIVSTQADYQQFVLIKDPRTILSDVNTTSFPINNNLAGLLRYQNLHPVQQQSTPTSPPVENSSQPVQSNPLPQDTSSSDKTLFNGIITSVVASGVVGIITWFVKTKVARKIAKDYHFTLEHVSSGASQIRIRNSGETIEDCVILCDRDACIWVDTNLNKPRHVYEGSVSSAKLPEQYETKNPRISVKSGKKILRRINLDEMAHG
ncbi:MAG: fibronectin type III domain-containing protein [Thaumarchaeota archaeon]|nr:fibronectin type III domain-containing protein [Nitrososphaerota archaeon]